MPAKLVVVEAHIRMCPRFFIVVLSIVLICMKRKFYKGKQVGEHQSQLSSFIIDNWMNLWFSDQMKEKQDKCSGGPFPMSKSLTTSETILSLSPISATSTRRHRNSYNKKVQQSFWGDLAWEITTIYWSHFWKLCSQSFHLCTTKVAMEICRNMRTAVHD